MRIASLLLPVIVSLVSPAFCEESAATPAEPAAPQTAPAAPVELSGLLDKVVALYKENDNIRYEAWKAIASVNDRASADAAAAKLAELDAREDKRFNDMRALLDTLPEEKVDDFCTLVQYRYQEESEKPGAVPADFSAAAQAAQAKLQELGSMQPPFYGCTDLQERAGAFVMMPR